MNTSQQEFVAGHYASRAKDYLNSANHSTGDDLDEIDNLLRGHASARVLDLGCGGGHVNYRAARHAGRVTACDVSAEMLQVVAQTAAERGLSNITVSQAAAEHLPFETGAFDFVLCRFSVHHWADREAGLREARRVLAPRGQAVFIDVIAPADPLLDTHLQAFELLRDPSHVRDYSLAEWTAALSRARFNVKGLTARKLHMEFPTWIARTHTPPQHADAIRSLQNGAPAAVKKHFAIAGDGSFDLDTATILAGAE